MTDRDKLLGDLKELTNIIKRNNLDKEVLFTQFRDKISQLEDDLKRVQAESDKVHDDYIKSERHVRSL
jgi:chromosome segregation ATPase